MAILSSEAKSMITSTHPGLVATADKSGRPNVSPKGSFQVLDDEHVLFANVHSPRTMANLEENPQVSAIVFDPATNHGVRIWGMAEVQNSGELFDRISSAMAARNVQAKEVVVIRIDNFTTF
jgi:predicted pyridoxine 5'-phosphate oxidase superfamily flavin-nucleotide-binding protein